MMCDSCTSRIEAALKAVPGAKSVKVDLAAKLANVEVEAPSQIDALNMMPKFIAVITELGFQAEVHIDYQL